MAVLHPGLATGRERIVRAHQRCLTVYVIERQRCKARCCCAIHMKSAEDVLARMMAGLMAE